MNKKEITQKIKDWTKKLKQLEEADLPAAQKRVGAAVEAGDWHENAEYEDAVRQVELVQTRINDIQVMIKKMEKELKK